MAVQAPFCAHRGAQQVVSPTRRPDALSTPPPAASQTPPAPRLCSSPTKQERVPHGPEQRG
eukprot:2422608-Prymnesium_polylepis.5